MMNCNFWLVFCACLLCSIILLYFYDPEFFYTKIVMHTHRIKLIFRTRFGKSGKEFKDKYRKLNIAMNFCEESISKYVNKKNLSTLQNDETINELLKFYRELLYMQECPETEVTLEKISELFTKVEETYFPLIDPYYNKETEIA